jgi:hypothetical protein
MWINDLHDQHGTVYAFEVSSGIGRRHACAVASRIPGSRILTEPTRVSWFTDADDFCRFEVDGQVFVISEPFGDNSRYWIGPEPPAPFRIGERRAGCPQLARVREVFAGASRWSWPFR